MPDKLEKLTRQEASKELASSIQWFREKGNARTVRWLEFILNNIKMENPSDYTSDIFEVISAYYADVEERGAGLKICSETIGRIIINVLKGNRGVDTFRSSLLEMYPLIVKWRITQENLKRILDLKNEKLSISAQYHLLLFLYLITIEGSYCNWIRILYKLQCISNHKKCNLSSIEDITPFKIKQNMIEMNAGCNIFFSGYFDGNLRNAIGHGDFAFNESTNRMIFNHTWNGQIKFREEISYDEFLDIFRLIDNFIVININYFFILRLTSYRHFFKNYQKTRTT